jgi:hypothetical protein
MASMQDLVYNYFSDRVVTCAACDAGNKAATTVQAMTRATIQAETRLLQFVAHNGEIML